MPWGFVLSAMLSDVRMLGSGWLRGPRSLSSARRDHEGERDEHERRGIGARRHRAPLALVRASGRELLWAAGALARVVGAIGGATEEAAAEVELGATEGVRLEAVTRLPRIDRPVATRGAVARRARVRHHGGRI